MGCSSSKIIEMTNHNNARSTTALLHKENKVEAILISKKIQIGNEPQDKIISLVEKNENHFVKNMRENFENDKANLDCNKLVIGSNPEMNNDNALLKININLAEKRELTNNIDSSKNKAQNNLSNFENKSNLNIPESKKNYSNKSNKNNNISNNNNYDTDNIMKIDSKDKQFNDNLALIANNNSKGPHNKEENLYKTCKLLQEECEESIKKKLPTQTEFKEENEKGENKINDNKYKNNLNLNNNIEVNESAISKLSSNIIKSKAQNLKDTNIVKDENELLLNLTKTQNLTHFQDDNQTKNLLNSIDKEDNLLIKFNTGAVANSLLNNTNFKINESQSQQNISNINNNPSICEENKSDRFSFKFDLTSNFDLHSRFSKFDSTNNISRIKVPYYENHNNNNNNYEQNYTLTNVSHTQDLNNITNLNNNNNGNNNANNNQNNNVNNQNNNTNNKNLNNPLENNMQNIRSKLHKESTDNMEEEEIQLSITLSVRASKFEAMYPIWIEKNREVEFKVIGKWSIDSTFPVCDCNGYQIKNKKETCNNNGNSNSNNNNNSNITSSTNYYTASTNNTNLNININSKNLNVNSNNLALPNSPTGNKETNIQEGLNKEADLIEVDRKSSNVNSALLLMRDSENNANLNVNVENTNINKNEIRIGYIGPSTIVINNSDNNNNNNNPTKNENCNSIEVTNNPRHLDQKHKNDSSLNNKNTNNNNNGLYCLLENYPNGCLIGRVLGGPYFRISSKCTFISEHSGPLFLKMNIHDLRLNPEGKLSVFINGADDLPFMSIEKKLGWDINNLSLGCQFLKTESERLIYTFINKIRLNSNLFAQQYLENIKTLSNTTNNLYVGLFENKESFNLLNMDAKLIEYGRRLVKREIERLYNLSTTSNNSNNNNNLNGNNNNNTNFISIINSNNPSAKNRQEVLESENKQILEYEKNLNMSGYSNLKYFIKKHEDTKPLSVAIKLIIDEKARQEILSKNSNSVGLLTVKLPQAQKGFYTCLLFGNLNSEQNLITEINRNESEIMMTD